MTVDALAARPFRHSELGGVEALEAEARPGRASSAAATELPRLALASSWARTRSPDRGVWLALERDGAGAAQRWPGACGHVDAQRDPGVAHALEPASCLRVQANDDRVTAAAKPAHGCRADQVEPAGARSPRRVQLGERFRLHCRA